MFLNYTIGISHCNYSWKGPSRRLEQTEGPSRQKLEQTASRTPLVACWPMSLIAALDAGTTSVRCLVFDTTDATLQASAQRPLTQHYPKPGWVEHDPEEIWRLSVESLLEACAKLGASPSGQQVAALGITNQRETVVAWDLEGGALAPAIVWQDRRTAAVCRGLEESGLGPLVRSRTGLVIDPYFSATKMAWVLEHGPPSVREAKEQGRLALGTVDSWLTWRLTGGPAGGRFVTDPTNASRTMCFDINERRWSEELCDALGVPLGALAELVPSAGRIGQITAPELSDSPLAGKWLSGMAGDQQASLLGHGCIEPASVKVTYGTGTFVVANAGRRPPAPVDGLVSSIAWDLGAAGSGGPEGSGGSAGPLSFAYALEGSIFASGAAVQWLMEGPGIISEPAELSALASQVPDSNGCTLVPAFTGLGSPWWDPDARAAIIGITRGTTKAHLARATIDALAFQTKDVLEAMASGLDGSIKAIKADGGVSRSDLLLQRQADLGHLAVERSAQSESTAWGAAVLAGLGEGIFKGLSEVPSLMPLAIFEPQQGAFMEADYARWLRDVNRVRTGSGRSAI
jgi:glycerol kinase